MRLQLLTPALYIVHQLQAQGFEAFIVGGAVRDTLLAQQQPEKYGHKLMDYDITTNAKPEEIQRVFPEAFYENEFGTVSLTHEEALKQLGLSLSEEVSLPTPHPAHRVIDPTSATKLHESLQLPQQLDTSATVMPDYQITTYRADEVYDDFRRPTSMNWGTTLEQDLQRRDFTINAMALAIPQSELQRVLDSHDKQLFSEVECQDIIDPFGGQQDLQAGSIKCVGTPAERFQEDALRMLRAIRFSVQLNMSIDDATFEAITAKAELIRNISFERIRDEFLKMLSSQYPAEAVELLDEAGLLQFIIPELLATKGVEQGGHHTTDVWVHSLDALRHSPSPDPIVRLATLLHDIAKPQTQAFQNNTITFYNHEIIGARVARDIAIRLKLSKKEVERIFILVRFHMFHYQPHNTDAAIRRFMRRVGLENIDDILALREGDRLGSGAKHTSWRLEEMKQRMIEQLHQPFSVKDLAINGDTLIQELGMQPGPQIGKVLNELFELVMEQPELNTRETLLQKAQELSQG